MFGEPQNLKVQDDEAPELVENVVAAVACGGHGVSYSGIRYQKGRLLAL